MSPSPTTAPPSWLEAAAKLDALDGEKVPLSAARITPSTDEIEDETELADGEESQTEATPVRPVSRIPAMTPEMKPRARIASPAVVVPASRSTEEVDLAWHGYSAAALVPSTVALTALTGGVLLMLRPLAPLWVIHESVDAPLAALWLLQAIRACYRLIGYNYRLTTRRLFSDRGRLYPPEPPLDLATVVRAEVRQSLLGALTGVGTVRVIPEDATPLRPAVELTGVRRPTVLASQIEEAATAARAENVVVGKIRGEPRA